MPRLASRFIQILSAGLIVALTLTLAQPVSAKTVRFAGLLWDVRPDGAGPPRDNLWRENNVFVDAQGRLHLKITYLNGRWYAADVSTQKRFGYGTYQWQVDTRLDLLDKDIVLGLFSYPTPDVGPTATHEIDIEFARWGNAVSPRFDYAVWPVNPNLQPVDATTAFRMTQNWSTHRYKRTRTSIRFQSTHGHYDDNRQPIADVTFAPADPARRISSEAMPVHMNFWIFNPPKAPAANGTVFEVIISDFTFTPD